MQVHKFPRPYVKLHIKPVSTQVEHIRTQRSICPSCPWTAEPHHSLGAAAAPLPTLRCRCSRPLPCATSCVASCWVTM